MKKMYDKKPIWFGIGVGYFISIVFVLLERLLLDLSYTDKWVYIDGGIRLLFGIVGLIVLKTIYADKFGELFKKKVSRNVLLYLLPIGIYFVLEFLFFACAKQIQTSLWIDFFVMWITQVTTGIWEEATSRGIVMSGMLMKWKDAVRGRILTVLISGLLFGSLHVLGVIYGNNIMDCLWSGLYTFCWGMFVAAIYMVSDNLLLVMGIHTIWDIVVKVPVYFISEYNKSAMLTGIYVGQDIIQLGVMPIVAILICIFIKKENKCLGGIEKAELV